MTGRRCAAIRADRATARGLARTVFFFSCEFLQLFLLVRFDTDTQPKATLIQNIQSYCPASRDKDCKQQIPYEYR